MNKPEKKARWSYDYHECVEYLEDKYNFVERDFDKQQDFWHWVMKRCNPHRSCEIIFHRETLEEGCDIPDWVKTIYGYFIDEFADEKGWLTMWIDW